MVKKVFLLFLFIVLLNLASSAEPGWGSVEQNKCIKLIQTCDNCTSNNITSIYFYKNSTQLLGNVEMTKSGTEYNYSFCSTSLLGVYTVNGLGDPNGVSQVWRAEFEVTPTGDSLNSSQAMIYIFLLIIFILLFLFSTYFGINIPHENIRYMDDEIVQVNWKKYLKMFCWGMSYFLLVLIVWFGWNLAYGYLQMRGLGIVLRYIYTLLMVAALPGFATIVILSAVSFFRDKNIQKMLDRGIPVLE